MKSKERDTLYGAKPRNIELTQETLPQSPAKKPYRGYCKKLKGEHVFALDTVKVYPHLSRPDGWKSERIITTGLSNWKEYRCTGCGKKDIVREKVQFEIPVEGRLASI